MRNLSQLRQKPTQGMVSPVSGWRATSPLLYWLREMLSCYGRPDEVAELLAFMVSLPTK
jgi:cyanate lyase